MFRELGLRAFFAQTFDLLDDVLGAVPILRMDDQALVSSPSGTSGITLAGWPSLNSLSPSTSALPQLPAEPQPATE